MGGSSIHHPTIHSEFHLAYKHDYHNWFLCLVKSDPSLTMKSLVTKRASGLLLTTAVTIGLNTTRYNNSGQRYQLAACPSITLIMPAGGIAKRMKKIATKTQYCSRQHGR